MHITFTWYWVWQLALSHRSFMFVLMTSLRPASMVWQMVGLLQLGKCLARFKCGSSNEPVLHTSDGLLGQSPILHPSVHVIPHNSMERDTFLVPEVMMLTPSPLNYMRMVVSPFQTPLRLWHIRLLRPHSRLLMWLPMWLAWLLSHQYILRPNKITTEHQGIPQGLFWGSVQPISQLCPMQESVWAVKIAPWAVLWLSP